MTNLQLILLSLGLIVAALLFARASRFIADKWTYEGDTLDQAPVNRSLVFTGGSTYPDTVDPPRKWHIIGRHVPGPLAKIRFSTSGFRFSLPGYSVVHSYKQVQDISAAGFGYLSINLRNGSSLRIRSTNNTTIYNAFRRHQVDVTPLSLWKRYLLSLSGILFMLIPFYILWIYFCITDPGDLLSDILWPLYPFVLAALRLFEDRR